MYKSQLHPFSKDKIHLGVKNKTCFTCHTIRTIGADFISELKQECVGKFQMLPRDGC